MYGKNTPEYRAAVVLDAAADLIESGHCQGANARTGDGIPCYPTDPQARSWDITGALLRVGRDAPGYAFTDALIALGPAVGVFGIDGARQWRPEEASEQVRLLCEEIWKWEDVSHRTTGHVLAALNRAKENLSL